ncbi:MAG: ATPase P [Deltaproteobacteria bacterium]|nr:ATPase P [Deltaproteobacteria bacterium]MBW1968046.1 ATPase P [Deltaproteobacteria bacterium]MBW2155183.1 ATPase P [Deltaproteobacteria bacterium]MBW2325267.1 ATPase P [Deltaproteobacteria bacterium]
MIEIDIPGNKILQLEHLVLDYNGTLAFDGALIDGVKESLAELSQMLTVHVITADTFGSVKKALEDIDCNLALIPLDHQDVAKLEYVKKLGCEKTVSMGNGFNDQLMLRESALGVAVIQGEGAAFETLASADIVCTDIKSALSLLDNPLRLIATLRS